MPNAHTEDGRCFPIPTLAFADNFYISWKDYKRIHGSGLWNWLNWLVCYPDYDTYVENLHLYYVDTQVCHIWKGITYTYHE